MFHKDKYKLKLARAWRDFRRYRIDIGLLLGTFYRLAIHRRSKQLSTDADTYKTILIIRLDAMGDVIMTTPVFREVKLRYPNSWIIGVVQERNRGLLETNPYVDQLLTIPAVNGAAWIEEIRAEISIAKLYFNWFRNKPIDIAISPRLGPDYYGAELLMSLAGASVSVRYADNWKRGPAAQVGRYALRRMTSLPRPGPQHEVVSNLYLVGQLTESPPTSLPEIFLTQEDRDFAREVLSGCNNGATPIAIAIGSLEGRKRWPLERWARVTQLLALHSPIIAVIVCSLTEKSQAETLQAMLEVESRVVCGAKLRHAAACIEACELFMGPDSGLAHMAAAVSCKSFVVSCHPVDGMADFSSSPIKWAPYSTLTRVIQPKTGMLPCREGCHALESHCILQITAEQVAQSCVEVLGRKGTSHVELECAD
jgi:heptosyltransferase-2